MTRAGDDPVKAALIEHFDEEFEEDCAPLLVEEYRRIELQGELGGWRFDEQLGESVYDPDAGAAAVIEKASAGVGAADEVLRAHAIDLLKRGEMPPPSLCSYICRILETGRFPWRVKQPVYTLRDERITGAIAMVQTMGVRSATRARAIVREFLAEDLELHLSDALIDEIWKQRPKKGAKPK